MKRRGIFITMEGPEGSGKTTHIARLAEKLRGLGCEVLTTREPGGTPAGEAIRDVLQHDKRGEAMSAQTETLLFMASRAQLVRGVIMPALARGAIVISDRFADSTIAYQGYGRGQDIEALQTLSEFAVDGAEPDLTLLLDLDVRRGFERLTKRYGNGKGGHDRIERENMAFHRRVRKGYLALAGRAPRRFRIIDADRGLEEVADAIWNVVRKVAEKRIGRRKAGGSRVTT